jgi:hypothetical protein
LRRPPPPGNVGGVAVVPPPAPPPPPVAVTAALREFIRAEVRPRTEAICLAGLVDSDLDQLCTEMANALAVANEASVVGTFMPLCADVCYHSCAASSNVDSDSFETCRGPECADTPCHEFLTRCTKSYLTSQTQT